MDNSETNNDSPVTENATQPTNQASQAESQANSTSQSETNSQSSALEFNEVTIMAALSYVGPLVIIPFMVKKENPFVMFHIKQGLVVFGFGLISWVLGSWFMIHIIAPFLMIFNLGLLVLSIIGVITALKQQEKNLPLVGGLAKNINI